jgi:hypothetical protein
VGDFEALALAFVESPLKYHPDSFWFLTESSHPRPRQSMAGSLAGAAASQRVTEARNGRFSVLGNHALSVKA